MKMGWMFARRRSTELNPGMRSRAGTALLAACLLASCTAGPALAIDPGEITTTTLANGMRVVLWPDHSIPNLALYTFFRAGSRNERPGLTGLSHFFEHMMFNGSKKYGPGEFDRLMEAAGGANNAFTTQDITVYQDWFPRSAFEAILGLEADRIENLAIDSTMVESERGVVMSERRRSVEDNNIRLVDEESWAAAFKAHPYQWPVIGWMVDIENWKIEDLRSYFRTYYAPNNATLVLVGAMDPKEALRSIRQHMEGIPSGPEPLAVTTDEPEQRGERRVEFHKPAEIAAFISNWHVPSAQHEDFATLRVLETLLLHGESSRLHRRLVEREEVALSVWGGLDEALDPTLFQVVVQVRRDAKQSRCETLVYQEIERLKQERVGSRELQKAKNQLAADFYRRLETLSGKAFVVGFSDVYFGDPKAFFEMVEKYQRVSSADVQRVVETYFQKRNRTVAVLVPEVETDRGSDSEASR